MIAFLRSGTTSLAENGNWDISSHITSWVPNLGKGERGKPEGPTWEKEYTSRSGTDSYTSERVSWRQSQARSGLPSKELFVLTGRQNWLKDAEMIFLEKLKSSCVLGGGWVSVLGNRGTGKTGGWRDSRATSYWDVKDLGSSGLPRKMFLRTVSWNLAQLKTGMLFYRTRGKKCVCTHKVMFPVRSFALD